MHVVELDIRMHVQTEFIFMSNLVVLLKINTIFDKNESNSSSNKKSNIFSHFH